MRNFGYNASQSMPRGWYYRVRRQTIDRGDIVAACLSPVWGSIGLRRHYLGKGRCRSGAAPVLKTVIALPGDIVSIADKGFFINGVYIAAERQKHDHRGYIVASDLKNRLYLSDGYWLYGGAAPYQSWDSRYWGSVSRHQIIGVYLKFR